MIITKIEGGLGNQMFQYAMGRVLAEKNSDQLYLDLTSYNLFQNSIATTRDFELDIFQFTYLEATKSQIIRLADSSPITNLFNTFLKSKLSPYPKSYLAETSHCYQPNILQRKGNLYLKGFWQTEKYFKDYEELIRKEFRFKKTAKGKNRSLLGNIISNNSVSVHVRRGDYVHVKTTNAFHGTCTIGYYEKAIKHMRDQLNNPTFYVFSDDIDWCKQNLKIEGKVVFSHNQGNKSWEDMRLMSVCNHNIIANSSFSWWGAWLNSNANKIVIAPRKWFRDPNIDTSDLIPSNWIRL